MKKLLSLLGSLSLTSIPMTTIISCSSKNKDSDNNETPNSGTQEDKPDFASIIANYKKEVTTLVSNELIKANKNLIEIEDQGQAVNNKFLKKEKILNYKGEEAKKLKDVETDKADLYTDIISKLAIENIKKEVNKLKEKTEYNIILNGVDNIFKDFKVDFENLEINYKDFNEQTFIKEQDSEKQNNSSFTSSIKVPFKITTIFKDFENKEDDSTTIESDFIYSLTNSSNIAKLGESIVGDLQNQFFINKKSSGKSAWLDSKSLNITDDDKILRDNNKVADYFNNTSFKNGILDFIKQDLESTKNNEFVKFLNFSDKVETMTKVDWEQSIKLTEKTLYRWNDENNGQQMLDWVFKGINKKDTKILNKVEQEVEAPLYKYIQDNSNDWLKTYKSNLERWVASLNDQNLNNVDLSSTSKMGFAYLKGLQFQIGNDYTQELPEFKILTSYSVDKEEKNWDNNVFKQINESKTVAAIYHNALKGINSFKNNFGITNTTVKNAISAFSGIKQGRTKNLWDTLKTSNNQYKFELNSSLSLKDADQREIRDILLKEGNQDIFEWKFNRISFNVVFDIDDKGLFNKSIYYKGEQYLDINFSIDFVSIDFRVDTIWSTKHKNQVILQKKV